MHVVTITVKLAGEDSGRAGRASAQTQYPLWIEHVDASLHSDTWLEASLVSTQAFAMHSKLAMHSTLVVTLNPAALRHAGITLHRHQHHTSHQRPVPPVTLLLEGQGWREASCSTDPPLRARGSRSLSRSFTAPVSTTMPARAWASRQYLRCSASAASRISQSRHGQAWCKGSLM